MDEVKVGVSGDLPFRCRHDLRLLLRIKGNDAISQIARLLPDDDMVRLSIAWQRVQSQLATAELTRTRWRPNIELITRRPHLDELLSALEVAFDRTRHLHHEDDEYGRLRVLTEMLWDAEWTGVCVDLSDDLPGSFRRLIGRHVVDGLLYPQVDVVPKEATSRMGTRGGYTVMSWQRSCRKALIPRPGWVIASFDFISMDLRSLMVMSKDLRRMIPSGDDPYMSIASTVFPTIPVDMAQAGRDLIKSCFVPMAYGASDETLSEAMGASRESISLIRSHLRPFLKALPIGPDLAREAQRASSIVFLESIASVGVSNLWRTLFPIHDELVMEIKEDGAPDIAAYIRDTLTSSAKMLTGEGYQVRVKIGKDYGSLVPLGIPSGR